MMRLLEIPFGNLPSRRSTTPSSRKILGIWFPFLLGGKLSNVDGSTRPRAQRMDRLSHTKLGLLPNSFSRFMVLTMIAVFNSGMVLQILQSGQFIDGLYVFL
jgi:hypothetical protein